MRAASQAAALGESVKSDSISPVDFKEAKHSRLATSRPFSIPFFSLTLLGDLYALVAIYKL